MSIVKLGKLSKAEALIALFNVAKPLGLGNLQYNPTHKLTEVEANLILLQNDYVDYLKGRVIKTRFPFSATEIDCTLYDRDNGEDSAEQAIRNYERVHYKQLGTECLYIPESFGGSLCSRIKDETFGVVYRFYIMGGKLVVFQEKELTSGNIKTFFRFITTSSVTQRIIEGNILITKDVFTATAHNVMIDAVNNLR